MLWSVFCSSNTKSCQKKKIDTYIYIHKNKTAARSGHGRKLRVGAVNAAHRPKKKKKNHLYAWNVAANDDFRGWENMMKYSSRILQYMQCAGMDETEQPGHHVWLYLVVPAAEPRARQVESQLRANGPVASQVLAVNEDHAFTPTLSTQAAMRQRRIITNSNQKRKI